MKLLFDTHTFIWWDSEPERLPADLLALCQDPTHRLILSVASVWEMQIKLQLGKLALKKPLAELIADQQEANGVEVLPVTLEHVLALDRLPAHHRDPFDRLLISQTLVEDTLLLTRDPAIVLYDVETRW
jgi:PIN domain nuclease of toxin-antitoxin system